MSKLLTRALQLEAEYNHKEHTPFVRGLKAHLKYVPLIVWTKNYSGASKQLLLGLTTSMEGIYKDEGKLGVFSPDLRVLSEKIAYGILAKSGAKDETLEMKKRLLSRLITGAMSSIVGLVELARENTKEKLEDEGVNYFTAFLTRGIIASQIPRSTLQSIASALEIEDRFSIDALETTILLLILKAFLPEENQGRGNLFEAMQYALLKNFTQLERELSDNRYNQKEIAPLNLFLKEGKALINEGNLERFLRELDKFITACELNTENLADDLKAMKALFKVLSTGFDVKERGTESQISFVG